MAVWALVQAAERVLSEGGAVAVVAVDPADRKPVERDLRLGRGLAPVTWAHLLERAGAEVAEHPVDDSRHRRVVIGRFG